MKKLFYSLLAAAAIIVSVSSCTEENVTPAKQSVSTNGGNTLDGDIKG